MVGGWIVVEQLGSRDWREGGGPEKHGNPEIDRPVVSRTPEKNFENETFQHYFITFLCESRFQLPCARVSFLKTVNYES